MDLGTGLAILGAKDVISKILGPTANYLGEELQSFAQIRLENLKKIFNNAQKKLGNKINNSGSVPPKVLRGTLNEGSYAEDFLNIEYFGGVLASSRTDVSHDDRGAYFNSLISRLSVYQIRMHYVFYHALKKLFNGENINFGLDTERLKLKLFMSITSFAKAMMFTDLEIIEETKQPGLRLDHIINGLLREDLIDSWFQYGNLEHLQKYFKGCPEPGIILQPNRLGFELFYWVYGLGGESSKTFFQKNKHFELDKRIIIDDGFLSVNKFKLK